MSSPVSAAALDSALTNLSLQGDSGLDAAESVMESASSPAPSSSDHPAAAVQPPAPVAPVAPVQPLVPVQPWVNQNLISIMKLNRAFRESLLEGEKVDVSVGGQMIFTGLPKRAFMAVSGLAHQFFLAYPEATVLPLEHGSVDILSLKHTLCWVQAVMTKNKTYAVPPGNNLVLACGIFALGPVLGMNQYMTHIEKKVRDTISERVLGFVELDSVLRTFPEGTAIFSHLAHNLTHARYNNLIENPEAFAHYLSEHPELSSAMDEIDRIKRAKYQAIVAARKAAQKEKRKAKALRKKAAKQEKEAQETQEKAERDAVEQKINAGGVHTITAEEAELHRAKTGH